MSPEEFATAVEKVGTSINTAFMSRSSEAIAHMYLDMAMNGLVASPIIIGEPFPIPLCRMIYLPSEGDSKNVVQAVNSYIYPADQVR